MSYKARATESKTINPLTTEISWYIAPAAHIYQWLICDIGQVLLQWTHLKSLWQKHLMQNFCLNRIYNQFGIHYIWSAKLQKWSIVSEHYITDLSLLYTMRDKQGMEDEIKFEKEFWRRGWYCQCDTDRQRRKLWGREIKSNRPLVMSCDFKFSSTHTDKGLPRGGLGSCLLSFKNGY